MRRGSRRHRPHPRHLTHSRTLASSTGKWHTTEHNPQGGEKRAAKASVSRYAASDPTGDRKPSDRVIGFIGILSTTLCAAPQALEPELYMWPVRAHIRVKLLVRPVVQSFGERSGLSACCREVLL
jgi:hypothetical protein